MSSLKGAGESSAERQALLDDLGHADVSRRLAAVRGLTRWEDAAVQEALVQAMEDPTAAVREEALEGLFAVGDSAAVAFLVPLLRSDVPAVRNTAIRALERLGRVEPQALVRLSREPDPRMRIFAANIMAGTGDHDWMPTLYLLLKDPEENVRDASIVALGRMRATHAVDHLAPLLAEPSLWVRFSVIDALSKMRVLPAARALVAALVDAEPDLVQPLVDAIGQQAPGDAIPLLFERRDGSPKARAALVQLSLGALRSVWERPDRNTEAAWLEIEVSQLLRKDGLTPELSAVAIEMLGRRGGELAREAVLNGLRSESLPVLESAARVAGRLRIPETRPLLEARSSNAPPRLRGEIELALRSIRGSGEVQA